MIEINNREDWKKGVKTFLENVTVPYDKEYKWPPAIYNENGDIFFQFNEYIDYIPNEKNIMTSSEEEKNDITKLFNLDSFDELLEIFNLRDEACFKAWNNIDKNNIKEEIESALKEAFGYSLMTFSEDEYNESIELSELDLEGE